MSERIRYVRVTIEVDTNKATHAEVIVQGEQRNNEEETNEEFLARIAATIAKLVDRVEP